MNHAHYVDQLKSAFDASDKTKVVALARQYVSEMPDPNLFITDIMKHALRITRP
jgi:hypothetical protein